MKRPSFEAVGFEGSMVSVVGPLGEATLAEAHERLESGGTPGKLALTVE